MTRRQGLVVAAAATSSLSLGATWASADTGPRGTAADSSAAKSGNTVERDTSGGVLNSLLGTPGYGAEETSSTSGIGVENTPPPVSDVENTPPSVNDAENTTTLGYGTEEPSSPPSCGCYEEEEPTPSTTTPPPVAEQSTPPQTPPVESTPQEAAPPQLAETGAESVLGAVAAGGALLTAGTVMYRRGRRAVSRR